MHPATVLARAVRVLQRLRACRASKLGLLISWRYFALCGAIFTFRSVDQQNARDTVSCRVFQRSSFRWKDRQNASDGIESHLFCLSIHSILGPSNSRTGNSKHSSRDHLHTCITFACFSVRLLVSVHFIMSYLCIYIAPICNN